MSNQTDATPILSSKNVTKIKGQKARFPKQAKVFFTTFSLGVEAKRTVGSSAKDVFEYCCEHCTYNKNEITLNADEKIRIRNVLGLKNIRTVEAIIRELKRKGFFVSKSGSVYMVNPYYAWRGELNTLRNVIKGMESAYRKGTGSLSRRATPRDIALFLSVPDGRDKRREVA